MYTKMNTNVSNMATFGLLRKKLDARLIRALILEREALSVTDASKRAGSSKIRASIALRGLMERGIVKREIVGRTHRYSFNYCCAEARGLFGLVLAEREHELSARLNAGFVSGFLKSILKENLTGVIFFGSCISRKDFKDIDVFLLFRGKPEEQEKVGRIFDELGVVLPGSKFSFMLGTETEVEEDYISGKDAFYSNLIDNGLPFGCDEFFINLRFRKRTMTMMAAAESTRERFILGVRELISCRKNEDDPLFLERHMEKGIFDVAYAVLNCLGHNPVDDYEAIELMKKIFGTKVPAEVKKGKGNVKECLEFARTMSSKIF